MACFDFRLNLVALLDVDGISAVGTAYTMVGVIIEIENRKISGIF